MDPELAKAHRTEPEYWEYDFRDVILYAAGIGFRARNDLRYVYEGHEAFTALPTYVVAPGLNSTQLFDWPGVDLDYGRILHGEQYIEVLKPIPTEGKLRNEARVVDVLDKGTGALIISEVTTYNDYTNEKLAIQQVGSFQVGSGNWGGRRTYDGEILKAVIPERAPDAVIEENIHWDQATLYRMGSMDLNPIHIDPVMTQISGFDIPILHGMCTLGFAFRHVLRTWAANDALRFKAMKVRFTSPVLPGQTLQTETWKDGDRIIFLCKVKETGKIVLNKGWIRFSEISEQPAECESLSAKL